MNGTKGSRKTIRCAIYTRKSTEEGLDQDFNSLDAQREACAAYILSQKHEGWSGLPDRYDDGGFSGGSMERPALTRLLAAIEAGRVDAVIVYKVDRLTRSLADFARIVAIFDAAGVSFVSITQAFNTTTSMGRLTLNVLLSFAQFEREVTAERIRDKIAASKAKGMWMGGIVPMGYRAEARSLVPEPEEARQVTRIFERYLALGSVIALKAELDAAGIRTPLRRHRNGRTTGGTAFSRGKLYAMLANPVCIGRIRHRDKVHPGQHDAIIGESLWEAVQQRLAANRRRRAAGRSAGDPSPLAGRVRDPDGRKMRPSHAQKKGRRYRYYVSAALIEEGVAHGARGWRIPAAELEAAVARTVAAKLRDPAFQAQMIASAASGAAASIAVKDMCTQLSGLLEDASSRTAREILRMLVTSVQLTGDELRADVSPATLRDAGNGRIPDLAALELPDFSVSATLKLQRRGPELRVVLGGNAAAPPMADPHLVRTLIEARCRLAEYLDPGTRPSIGDIARREGADIGDVSRSLQLAFLAPDLVQRILDGTQPVGLTAERLRRIDLPALWEDQRAILG
ncbi:MAG: recombinase family protein [Rhodovulum sp.]|nr:recombinase family protein [Rhodovulum sp.]